MSAISIYSYKWGGTPGSCVEITSEQDFVVSEVGLQDLRWSVPNVREVRLQDRRWDKPLQSWVRWDSKASVVAPVLKLLNRAWGETPRPSLRDSTYHQLNRAWGETPRTSLRHICLHSETNRGDLRRVKSSDILQYHPLSLRIHHQTLLKPLLMDFLC